MTLASAFTGFFDEILDGRLGRLGFLWRFAALLGIFLAISVGLGMTGGIARFAGAYFVIVAILGFTMANIFAKRLRTFGLWGWSTLLLFIAAGALLASFVPGPFEIYYALILVLLLAFVPGKSGNRSGA